MYRLLQNYTLKICTLSKIMNTCCKYYIFLLVDPYLQSIGMYRQVFCTHVCVFDTVFIFIVNLNIKKFLKFTSKHCKLIRENNFDA